jgi:uncharacterized membrane protein YfcA
VRAPPRARDDVVCNNACESLLWVAALAVADDRFSRRDVILRRPKDAAGTGEGHPTAPPSEADKWWRRAQLSVIGVGSGFLAGLFGVGACA